MKKEFVSPNNPTLIAIAEEVSNKDIKSTDVQMLIENMFTIAFDEQIDRTKPVLVGLAAPQIGISKRIILVDIAANDKNDHADVRVYINPSIVYKNNEYEDWYEGCYSTGHVCGIVSRPTKIRIQALDQNGNMIAEEYEGFVARIFQHEIDHLNGRVFIDLINDDDKLHWVEENEFPEYRQEEHWNHWKRLCLRSKWDSIKHV